MDSLQRAGDLKRLWMCRQALTVSAGGIYRSLDNLDSFVFSSVEKAVKRGLWSAGHGAVTQAHSINLIYTTHFTLQNLTIYASHQ